MLSIRFSLFTCDIVGGYILNISIISEMTFLIPLAIPGHVWIPIIYIAIVWSASSHQRTRCERTTDLFIGRSMTSVYCGAKQHYIYSNDKLDFLTSFTLYISIIFLYQNYSSVCCVLLVDGRSSYSLRKNFVIKLHDLVK